MLQRSSNTPGEPLVLIHGWGCSADYWRRFVPVLEQAGFQPWIATLPGYDGIRADITSWSFMAAADNLAAEIEDHISKPVHLVGHSMGMFVATTVASTHPQLVESLTMLGIVPDPPSRAGSNPAVAELVASGAISESTIAACLKKWYEPEVLEPRDAEDLSQALRRVPASVLLGSAEACMSGLGVELIDMVKAPILVVVGEHDTTRRMDDVRAFVLADTDRTLKVISGAGHMPQWTHPETVVECLREVVPAISV